MAACNFRDLLASIQSYRNPCWQTNGTLACLPFFYLAGFPKCGTTDLYTRISMHQHVRALLKEPHWITRERYKGKGDCSASTMWDNDVWFILPGNSNCSEPHIIHADYIRHLVPDTKIIVLLREPISRKITWQLVRVQLGLYHVFLEDWLLRFPLSQILVMRMEDMRDNVTREMLNVYSFLGLGTPAYQAINCTYYSQYIDKSSELLIKICHGGQTQFPAGRHQSTGCCCLLPSTSSSLRVLDLCFLLTLLLLFAHREELWRLCRHVLKTTDAQSRDPNLGLLVDLGPSTPPEAYDLFKLGPFHFLDNFRNPCWLTSDTGQLACLPFFFLAGFPKCGTTELYVKLHKHQHVAKLLTKEPHWLTRLRYQNESESPLCSSLSDGSASTVWDNDRWYMLPDSSYYSEPYVTHADYVRHLLPAAKIIIILRNPTLRIYSDYNFFFTNGSLSEFHELAVKQMDILKSCFAQHTVRSCVYNQSLNSVFRIRLGLYHVFLEDWFQRFPRDQIHVLRLEDLAVNVTRELLTIYRFLGLVYKVNTSSSSSSPSGDDSLDEKHSSEARRPD
ncbi:hypothetical protein C0Q70_08908 [Pomacea canaliculata]|uniref:Sulfotransferase domain-containing protein n=1 Tax=Pomacea canaliculata TaxID=400727 RepID=A0A2T7P8C1_POMCA|nr:hypothetical protein C0Q70_08908 [Pomacea canaliculata]